VRGRVGGLLRHRALAGGAATAVWLAAGAPVAAQELIPAAYTPAPVGANLVSFASYYNDGDLAFDPAGPIDEANAQILASTVSYARTFGLLGQSANATIIVPWVVGDLEGLYLGEPASASRSGLGDLNLRLGLNLYGGPAMSPQQFASYRPKTLIGASLIVRGPTGEYDPAKLVNIGTNRWSFKPEVGIVQVMGKWAIDAYVGGWFFTDNTDFAGGKTREQAPILSTQFHVRYIFHRGLWVAVDANFWRGGQTTVDGVTGDDLQENSRYGATVAWQVAPGHQLRLAASRGAFTRIGGDFDSFGLAYSYSWMKRPAPPTG
jgi:hypothetical protein